MSGIIMCIISLALANFGVEYFADANYMDATRATWHQLSALLIYYWFWVRPELSKED